ncbi:Solute carrier family 25 member 40 [Nymphon striatum]|nr:Solute carrier family 25 member 40 [Nymphon striatum]
MTNAGDELKLISRETYTHQMLSSCTGAILTSLIVTPLDVVKIRLQVQEKRLLNHKCVILYCNGLMDHVCSICGKYNGYSKWFKNSEYFTGTMDAFLKISRAEGISSLWSGLPPTLVMAVPATVVYFTSYDNLKLAMTNYFKPMKKNIWIPVLSGSIARTFAVLLISPLELVRTKLQSQKLSYFETGKAVKDLVKHRGYLSLWRGLGPTLLRDVPFSAIYWSSYEYLKYSFNQKDPEIWFSFTAGATSGTLAGVLTLPFDVIKTHRQIELGEKVTFSENPKKLTSTFLLMKNLYDNRGISGLFAESYELADQCLSDIRSDSSAGNVTLNDTQTDDTATNPEPQKRKMVKKRQFSSSDEMDPENINLETFRVVNELKVNQKHMQDDIDKLKLALVMTWRISSAVLVFRNHNHSSKQHVSGEKEDLDDSVVILGEVKAGSRCKGVKRTLSCDTSTSPFIRPSKKIQLFKTPKTVMMADASTSITPNRFSEPIPMNLMPTMSSSEAYKELIEKTKININKMKETRRPIVIDGSHKNVIAIVPQNRRRCIQHDGLIITDRYLLEELMERQNIIFTPARNVQGKTVVSYDDRFIISLAANTGGVIVSNDQYRDLLNSGEEKSWIEAIEKRLLQYVFAHDLFMIPDDPLGKTGPTLTKFLSFPERTILCLLLNLDMSRLCG